MALDERTTRELWLQTIGFARQSRDSRPNSHPGMLGEARRKAWNNRLLDFASGEGLGVAIGVAGPTVARSWMKHAQLRFGKGFRVSVGNKRGQAAEMVIAPGDCEGGPDNRHRGADQWLFVVAGKGLAIVNRKRHSLRDGSIVLIEKGDRHEIRNTGRSMLKTVNIYVPPAYRRDGSELPRGRK